MIIESIGTLEGHRLIPDDVLCVCPCGSGAGHHHSLTHPGFGALTHRIDYANRLHPKRVGQGWIYGLVAAIAAVDLIQVADRRSNPHA
jgi:hypothetical protein